MLSLKNSLKVLKKTKALLDGHFVLSSGLHSDRYIQCAKLLSFPKNLQKLTQIVQSPIQNPKRYLTLN